MGIDKLCIDTIRQFAPDVVQKANSGHPGAPMGCAPIAHILFSQFIRQSATNYNWPNRDRFVLSNGHACVLLYTMAHLMGYNISMDDLKSFRQLGSRTPGHPERKHLDDYIDVSTGPLGQGIANAVGMAMAAKNCAAKYNEPGFSVFDSKVYVLLGDGCMQEGVQAEAISLAGHLKLGNLIALYDDNSIQIDGSTELAFTEDVLKRYEACGWHTQKIDNSEDLESLQNAIKKAISVEDKPSIIKVKTVIGVGSKKQGTEKVHGAPLGEEDIAQLKKNMGFDPSKTFYIPDEVYQEYKKTQAANEDCLKNWTKMFNEYSKKFPAKAAEINRIMNKELPEKWESALPKFTPNDPPAATRKLSEMVLNAICEKVPEIFGGSADLTPSNLTKWKGSEDFQPDGSNIGSYEGRYIRFGVREHGMSAICNGIAGYGFHIPFGATFLNFVGYAMGAIRLSALSKHQVLYIGTHDSIGLGEDGPTHQPIETAACLRAMPNVKFYRPADGNEVSGCYLSALKDKSSPCVIALSRQNVPNQKGSSIENTIEGAYTIYATSEKPNVILAATGSEVDIAIKTADLLFKENIASRVVSMPCWEAFSNQPVSYKMSVFTPGTLVVSIEALCTFGWSKWAHYSIGIDTFGESGKADQVYKHFGITPEACLQKVKQALQYYQTKHVEEKIAVCT